MPKKSSTNFPLPSHVCTKVADAAGTTPLTVHNAINRGLPGKPIVRARIMAAIESLGLGHLVPRNGGA
jgi:hypothetical protein